MEIRAKMTSEACSTLVASMLYDNVFRRFEGKWPNCRTVSIPVAEKLGLAVHNFNMSADRKRAVNGEFAFGYTWFHEYAHLLFSVTDHEAYGEIRKFLDEIEEAVCTPYVYNKKNRTNCKLYIVPVPTVLKLIEYKKPRKGMSAPKNTRKSKKTSSGVERVVIVEDE